MSIETREIAHRIAAALSGRPNAMSLTRDDSGQIIESVEFNVGALDLIEAEIKGLWGSMRNANALATIRGEELVKLRADIANLETAARETIRQVGILGLELAEARYRRDELLASNNEYLEEARAARARVQKLETENLELLEERPANGRRIMALEAALARIDAINDQPGRFNVEIEAVLQEART